MRGLTNHVIVFTHHSTDNAKQLSNIKQRKVMMRFAFLKHLYGVCIRNGMLKTKAIRRQLR